MEKIRFDIAAKYPPDTKSDDRPLMLRTLLEDRFKLAVHRESKDMPGYALVVAKRGFKLQPVEPGAAGASTRGDQVLSLTAKKTSMARLADLMARSLGEMVVDKTGIEGVYDFELRWTCLLYTSCDRVAAVQVVDRQVKGTGHGGDAEAHAGSLSLIHIWFAA